MEINKNTSQADLQRLYTAVVKREFLKGTPLNLKAFLRYAVLFILFPGMIFGFYVGLAITAAFCGVLLTLVLTDNMHWGMTATLSWLGLGLIPTVFVTIDTWRRAARTRAQRMMERSPLPGAKATKAVSTDRTQLKWRPKKSNGNTIRIADATVKADTDGVYAFLLTIENYSGTRLLTDGPAGMCLVQSSGKKGETLQALLLYRLKAGTHEICWSLQADESPQTYLSRLN
ncbi:MAG: hypothetical protein IKZ07_09135 [Akkermansia sp.]|nr:hypothetical protein [Akkermansia sp.]